MFRFTTFCRYDPNMWVMNVEKSTACRASQNLCRDLSPGSFVCVALSAHCHHPDSIDSSQCTMPHDYASWSQAVQHHNAALGIQGPHSCDCQWQTQPFSGSFHHDRQMPSVRCQFQKYRRNILVEKEKTQKHQKTSQAKQNTSQYVTSRLAG